MNSYVAKIKLSNYINSRLIELENDDGVMEKGIFIPIELNELFVSPRNQVISWMFVNEKLHDTGDGYSHYLKMKSSKKHVDYINSLGYETPYMGNMKSNVFTTQYHQRMRNAPTVKVKKLDEYE